MLKNIRILKNITQKELSEKTKIPVRTIQDIEKNNNTDVKRALIICKELEETVENTFKD